MCLTRSGQLPMVQGARRQLSEDGFEPVPVCVLQRQAILFGDSAGGCGAVPLCGDPGVPPGTSGGHRAATQPDQHGD